MSVSLRCAVLSTLVLPQVAVASTKAEARAVFDDYVEREHRFDPSQVELFADDAVLVSKGPGPGGALVESRTRIGELRAMYPMIMALAEVQGNVSTYDKVKVTRSAEGFTVTATRFDERLCYTDDGFTMELRDGDAGLRISQLSLYVQEKSECGLEADLAAVRDMLKPMLPAQVDEQTRMEDARVEGHTLVVVQRRTDVAVEDEGAVAMGESLRAFSRWTACNLPLTRGILDAQGTVRYSWLHAGGEPLVDVDVAVGDCE